MGQFPSFSILIGCHFMEEYYGRFTNILDSKGRINLPAQFREVTEPGENGEQTFILTVGSEKYVVMFPVAAWREMMSQLDQDIPDKERRRKVKRKINYHARRQKIDKQGRINIPSELIRYANLKNDVVVLGTGDKIEIWNPEEIDEDIKTCEPEYRKSSDKLDF